jgi:hypothetical protein
MKTTLLLLATLTLASCSSTIKERTIASMDDTSRPGWASLEKSAVVKDGKLFILGFKELDADAKISSALRLSDNAARGELAKMIKNDFSSILQNLEEGVGDGGEMARFYSSEVTKLSLNELRVVNRYWEKVQSFDRDGEATYKLRVYSLAEIPEAKLKKLIRQALNNDGISQEVKKQALDHFESEIRKFQSH